MQLFSKEAKVGVVILTALAILTWLSFQVGVFRFRQQGYPIEVVFRTVSGLEPKSKVRLAGVVAGSVDRIFLREGRAHAILRLNDGIVVREDSVISVASIGILSERYIEITAGTLTARPLAPGAVVAGRELVDLDQLIVQLSETMGTINTLAASLRETFGGQDSTVALLMQNTNALVDRLNVLLDENRRHVGELLEQSAGLARDTRALLAENRDELHGTIANLRDFSASLKARADELAAQVTRTAEDLRGAVRGSREDLQAVLASLRAASGKAEQAADSLTSILKKVDDGRGTLGRLVNDETSITRIDRAVDQIGGIAEKINAGQGSIGRLVNDDKLVSSLQSSVDSINKLLGAGERTGFYLGLRSEYLFDIRDFKNYATVKLQPRPDKYYLLELIDKPTGKRSIANVQTKITRPEGDYTIEEHTVTDDVTSLTFSLQFAKDFGDLTLRGGLFESTGGIAADYRPFHDRLRLSLEGWDFDRGEGPHFKFTGRLKLYKDTFVNAGVDDLLLSDGYSAFVGVGVLFSDEDLKSLLTLSRFSQ